MPAADGGDAAPAAAAPVNVVPTTSAAADSALSDRGALRCPDMVCSSVRPGKARVPGSVLTERHLQDAWASAVWKVPKPPRTTPYPKRAPSTFSPPGPAPPPAGPARHEGLPRHSRDRPSSWSRSAAGGCLVRDRHGVGRLLAVARRGHHGSHRARSANDQSDVHP